MPGLVKMCCEQTILCLACVTPWMDWNLESVTQIQKECFNTLNVVPMKYMRRCLPVHIMKLVDGVDGQHHLTNVEPCHVFWKLVFKFTK